MYRGHSRAAVAPAQGSCALPSEGQQMDSGNISSSQEIENMSQDRHMTQLVMGTAQMPTGWQTKGIRTFARSADATSCRWSLPHALLKLCHLMPLCGHLWALCCASSQLLGAGTNKDFGIATSTKDKDTNYTGIQQQLICFHASVTTRYMEDNFRASCPVLPA